jgi:cysteinyl-tRNA synthetase
MSEKTLGLPFDIHGGGRDLTFPHHENEIAQSCCSSADASNPKSYVNYWMHNGFVTVDGEKMSKSLGNISLVKDLIKENDGEVIRLSLLSSHYRQGLDWNEKVMHQAKVLLDKLYKILVDIENIKPLKINESTLDFIDPLMDDLNTPGLLANLNKLIKDFKSVSHDDMPQFKSKLLLATNLIGICQQDYKSWFKSSHDGDEKVINDLISERLEAKRLKNFDKADELRQKLMDMHIEIKDTESGTDWNYK